MPGTWQQALDSAVRNAKIEVVGQHDVRNEAQAKVVISVLRAYGDSPAGFLYIEPCTARSTVKPPDVLLCHPQVGILIIEVKGYVLKNIQGTKAGSLHVLLDGMPKVINPLRQVEEAMYNIRDAVKRERNSHNTTDLPLFNFLVAFPNIYELEWNVRGFALPSSQVLFREQIDSSKRLQQRIALLVQESSRRFHKEKPITYAQSITLRKVFGDSAVLNEDRDERSWAEKEKLGSYIDELAALEKFLSSEQQTLSRLNIEGHPRLVRGVAGSGKTIVLANQVARFVSRKLMQSVDLFNGQQPKPRVAVVCFNRSLVPFIKAKIECAYKQHTFEDLPGEDVVLVTYLNGLVWRLGSEGILSYIKTTDIHDPDQRAEKYREQLRQFAAENPAQHKAVLYDAIFVDEGQDFSPEEFRLLHDLLNPHPQTGEKTLTIFYDDAQNLYARTRPNWKQLGIDVQGGDRARVMKECFRNTQEVVELAFNVLLGSQAPAEMQVQTRTYADIGYLKQLELVEELGDYIRVHFAQRHYQRPMIRKFSSRGEEKAWLAAEIARLIEEEQVRAEDILVLFPRKDDFRDLAQLVAAKTGHGLIKGFIQPYGDSPDKDAYIFREGHLTLSTTYGAKGYDAQIVFLAGADLFDQGNEGRASFYVGATRSKLLLYITVLSGSGTLITEAESLNIMR